MSFGKEVKDFLGAATSTYKTISDAQYNQLKGKYLQAQIDNMPDDEDDALAKESARLTNQAKKNNIAIQGEHLKQMRTPPAPPPTPIANSYSAPVAPAVGAAQPAPVDQGAPGYADGGAIPTADDRERGKAALRARFDKNDVTRRGAWWQEKSKGDEINHDAFRAVDIEDDLEADRTGKSRDLNRRMVPGYAGGGVVQEALPMQSAQPRGPVAAAIPTGGDPQDDDDGEDDDVTPVATDISARRRVPNLDAGIDASVQGMLHGVQRMGLHTPAGVRDAQRQRALQLYAQGYGAVSPEDMQALYKKVDPEGKLTDGERNIAALGAVWKYKIAKNDLAGAKEAAADMMMHYKIMSQRYAAMSAAAAHHGDIDGAARAAMAAYSQIPDGKDLKVVKTPDGQLAYQFTDMKTGKAMQSGVASPDQLASAAMGLATKGFEPLLLQAAGERQPKPAVGGKGNGALKPKEVDQSQKNVDGAYSAAFPAQDEKGNALPQPGADEARDIKGAIYRITRNAHNSDKTPEEAAAYVKKFLSVDKEDPDRSPFKSQKIDEDNGGGYVVQFGAGRKLHLTDEENDQLMDMRAARVTAAKAASKKADEDKKKPSLARDLLSATRDNAGNVVSTPGAAGDVDVFGGQAPAAGAQPAPKRAIPDGD